MSIKKVICISGKAGSGKDTFANYLKEALEKNNKKVLITHNADLLKYICKTFLGWDGNKDEKGRSLLQYVGTEVIREKNPDYWVDFLVFILKAFSDKWDYVIIPDTRFENEISKLKENGFDVIHISVFRENKNFLSESQHQHASETSMDDVSPDLIVNNNKSIDDVGNIANDIALGLIAQEIINKYAVHKKVQEKLQIKNEEHCIICGSIIPEGRQICSTCEKMFLTQYGKDGYTSALGTLNFCVNNDTNCNWFSNPIKLIEKKW